MSSPKCSIGIAVCLSLFAAGAVRADDATSSCPIVEVSAAPKEPVVSRQLLDELIGWIALHTSYDVSQLYRDPPAISFCSVGEQIVYEGRQLFVEPELNAAFDLPNRRLHIVLPWSPENLFDRSVLLHELIHDVQLSNRDWPCIGAPEFEAYDLQDRWLLEHGIDHPFNWLAILTLSTCPDPARILPEHE